MANQTDRLSTSTSDSIRQSENRNENRRSVSNPNLNSFFDSYVSDVSQQDIAETETVCSDSISRYDGNGGDGRHRQNADCLVQIRSSRSGSAHVRQPMASEPSSLATLVSEKRISDSRRTFCLFVTFDFILTSILWLFMCGTSSGNDGSFFQILVNQITNYTLCTSMFDVVCLAAARFAFLQITYALLWIRHWWPVAVSTGVSDILLILKIFPIFQDKSPTDALTKAIPMIIVILLVNFVLTWIEVWFIDFKVLPEEARLAERTVRQFINTQGQPNLGYTLDEDDETTPLIRPIRPTASSFYTAAQSDRLSYHSVLESEFDGSVANGLRGNLFPIPISPEDQVHVERGKQALHQLWSLYNDKTVWKVDKQLENGDTLYTTSTSEYGKSFRIDATIRGVATQVIFREISLKAEAMPTWNSALSDVKILKRIGEQTAISLEVSAPAGKGLIQSRDFVTVRRVDKINKSYISAGISTDYEIPPSDRIRGINGPTGFILTPCEGEFAATKFTWILNTNLKVCCPLFLLREILLSSALV